MNLPACVITTINWPTAGIKKLVGRFPASALIVVGDQKTPKNWKLQGTAYFSLQEQAESHFVSHQKTPFNHYARKNLGYLKAMRQSPSVIYDTDDDNIPNKAWQLRRMECSTQGVNQKGWCNVYRHFHIAYVWPRGFPLEHVNSALSRLQARSFCTHSPIQQGLADGNPDVDAIWRLLLTYPVYFRSKLSIQLAAGVWCPFNSQSTWWWPEAYPLMYLPIHATFRMTDIWRSFIAQRCLWEMGYGVIFHSPAEVEQKRNLHSLLRDFSDEVPGYLQNSRIADILQKLRLRSGKKKTDVCHNLLACYTALVRHDLLPDDELFSVNNWVTDLLVPEL